MLSKIATWMPTIILGVLIGFAFANGATGIEWVVVIAFLLLQALVIVVPRVARWLGRKASNYAAD